MIDDLGISGALREVQDDTEQLLLDTAQLLLDTVAALAKLPTSGKAVSDAVWDAALKATIQNRARVKVQTGFVNETSLTAGSGEDLTFINVPIAAVSAIDRCIVTFDGGAQANNTIHALTRFSGMSESTAGTAIVTCRLTTTTNLRLSVPLAGTVDRITGRWTVVDGAATS